MDKVDQIEESYKIFVYSLIAQFFYWILSYIVNIQHVFIHDNFPTTGSTAQPSLISPLYNIYSAFAYGSGGQALTRLRFPLEVIWFYLGRSLAFIPISIAIALLLGYSVYYRTGGRHNPFAWTYQLVKNGYTWTHRIFREPSFPKIFSFGIDIHTFHRRDIQQTVFLLIGSFLILEILAAGVLISSSSLFSLQSIFPVVLVGIMFAIGMSFIAYKLPKHGEGKVFSRPAIWQIFLIIIILTDSVYKLVWTVDLFPQLLDIVQHPVSLIFYGGLFILPWIVGFITCGLLVFRFEKGLWVTAWWLGMQFVLWQWIFHGEQITMSIIFLVASYFLILSAKGKAISDKMFFIGYVLIALWLWFWRFVPLYLIPLYYF